MKTLRREVWTTQPSFGSTTRRRVAAGVQTGIIKLVAIPYSELSLIFDARTRLEIVLREPETYRRALARLAARAKREPRLLRSDPLRDGLSLGWMLSREAVVVKELSRAFCRDDFAFGPVVRRRAHVGGKERDLYLAGWPDRLLHRVLAETLQTVLEPTFSPRLFSFRKGRSQRGALRGLERFVRKRGRVFVVKADVSQYGESIDRQRLLADLTPHVGDGLFHTRVGQALAPFVITDRAMLPRGLPTGAAFVPVLENLFLAPLDQLLASHGIFHARFGDDFLLASDDEADLEAAWTRAQALLTERGLLLKAEKVKRGVLGVAAKQPMHWLGARVAASGSIGVSDERWREWRMKLVAQCQNVIEAAFSLPPHERKDAARAALTAVLDARLHVLVAGKEVRTASLAGLDAKLVQTLVRAIGRQGLKKRDAWRWLRSLRLRGLSAPP